ncbi:MAG: hypothetical protein K9M84_12575, partial [Spirochaetia bacterium]|nr:hypothetical protein [Spirochaetia bacterium]
LLIPVLWDQQSLEMNLREADHPLRLKDTVWIRTKYSAVWSCYTDSGHSCSYATILPTLHDEHCEYGGDSDPLRIAGGE